MSADARPGIYPMTREQEALWIDDLVWDGSSRHVEALSYRLTGLLNFDALEWTINRIVSRHEVLRSRLTELDEQPVQIVTAPRPVRIERLTCTPATLDAELRRIALEAIDLGESPLRPWLISLSPEDFVLVVQLHHAVIDDWSLNIIGRELKRFYTARVLGHPLGPEPLPAQSGDFALAQRAAEPDPVDVAYWRERVRDAPRSCTIPPDHPGPVDQRHRAARHVFDVDPELGKAVRATARAFRATPFIVFTAAMAALLWEYGEPDEVIFGTPVSLRGTAAVEDLIGCLTNLHPIRLAVARDTSFRALARATKAEVLGAMAHRDVPYATIVQLARRGWDPDAPPPCDVALVVDDMRWEPFSLPDLTAELFRMPPGHAKFALHLSLVAREDGGYAGACNYDADLFDAGTITDVAERFTGLLSRGSAAPDAPLAAGAASAAEAAGARRA